MAELKINQSLITPETAEQLVKICPFSAISYDGELHINSACKMCKLCVKKGPKGAVEYVEDEAKVTVDKSEWRGIAVFADCADGGIHPVTFELIGKAKELAAVIGHPVYAVLMCNGDKGYSERLLKSGVDKVFVYDSPIFENFTVTTYANAFANFINATKPSSVLVGATNIGRSLAPRVACRFRTGLTADCTRLEMKENTDLVQIRPAFGGNIMAQIISPDTRPQFCTVRYKVFAEPKPQENPSGEIVKMDITKDKLQSLIEILGAKDKPKDVDISEADVVVAVGRGAMSEGLRQQAKELADLLGGVVACSRPLVEGNLFDAKRQIGLSGRTVNAKFIICLGI